MLPGSMQAEPLAISRILDFASAAHGTREIVSRLVEEPTWRYDWAGCAARCRRLAGALGDAGIVPGDRVSSLAWNTHRHLELFYAAPGIGAVLHTANPRLSDEQIAFTINHAGSRFLFFERCFAELVERLRPRLGTIERFAMLTDEERLLPTGFGATSFEGFIAEASGSIEWPVFDENSAAFLCYTSGTTGDPKGVLYSHRSVVLHAMAGG